MFLREPKIPFSDSSNPRASGLLRKEEALDTSITVSKDQIQKFDQQTHLLRGVLQNESLRLDKLRDHGLSRSALPLSRAAPIGLSQCSRSRVDRAHYGAHSLPLRRRPVKKKKPSREGNNSEGYQAVLTCHYSQQKRRSVSASPSNRRPARPLPDPGRPMPSNWPRDLHSKNNHHQSKILWSI